MLWIPVAIIVIVLLFAIFRKKRNRWDNEEARWKDYYGDPNNRSVYDHTDKD